MNNNKLLEILMEMGLPEREAEVYLVSLALGPSTVMKIARASDKKRSTTYLIIDALKKRGLMSIQTKGLKSLFVAEDPEKLEAVLEQRKNLFRKHLPEFSALYNTKGEDPIIKTYEGLEAVKTIYEGLLKDIRPGEDYLVMTDIKRWFELDKKYFTDFMERRAKLSIKTRVLLQNSDEAERILNFQRNFNEEVKILPKERVLKTNLIVTPERVVIHQMVEPIMAIVIENRNVIAMHKETFEIIWESLKTQPINP